MFPLLTKLSQVCLHLALREQSWRGNISVAIRGEAPEKQRWNSEALSTD